MKRPRVSSSSDMARDAQFIDALSKWFPRHKRNLPWRCRRMRSGYPALVAEIMLQQTQVSRVAERFAAFMRTFPTVASLARASEQDVLAMWNGLGYYRRARHLHAAARMIVNEFDGRVPNSAPELQRLPGVGRYTAGAIASIIFGKREPIVDGNVERVLSRFDASKTPAAAATRHKRTWKRAMHLVMHANNPGVFNEALMELGATICTPMTPSCDRCPVAGQCQANLRGIQSDLPLTRARKAPRPVHHHAVVLSRNGKVLVRQRPSAGMWAAMWETPTIESDQPLALADVRKRLGVAVQRISKQEAFIHQTTHRRITFHIYCATSRSGRGDWKSIDQIMQLPMSNAQRRVLQSFMQKPA